MYDRTIAIYCFIDDLLKAMQHREDARCEVSDAEVVTIALCAMLWFGGNFEHSRSFLHSSGMMPRMLSRSRLSRRLTRLAGLVEIIFHQLGLTLKELNTESRYAMDSFPIAVCDNIRISRCRLTKERDYRGYLASKRRYFYGVRVQVMVTVDGIPIDEELPPWRLTTCIKCIITFHFLIIRLPISAAKTSRLVVPVLVKIMSVVFASMM